MKKSKRYNETLKLVDSTKIYETEEAIELALQTSKAKFDETIELHVKLGVDGRNADQQVRGVVVLPNGTGKTVRVLVIAKGDAADAAEKAGADIVGAEEIVTKIQGQNFLDFDVCITTPDMMGLVGRCAKILGPKGLMPNAKTGTVTMDLTKAVNEIKAGKVEYRVDKTGNIQCLVGKVSFDDEKLVENIKSFVSLINKTKPSAVKGKYMLNIAISTTMGPGIKVDVESFEI